LILNIIKDIINFDQIQKKWHIIEMIGSNKANETLSDLLDKSPFSCVLGDILRIACYEAGGKPGMIVHPAFDKKGNLIYTIMKFNHEVGEVLRQNGAFLAVDVNRKSVKDAIQQDSSIVMEKIEELFEITSNLNLETDLGWYSANSENEMEVFTLFRELTELIIGVK
jgi:hypothetical protein